MLFFVHSTRRERKKNVLKANFIKLLKVNYAHISMVNVRVDVSSRRTRAQQYRSGGRRSTCLHHLQCVCVCVCELVFVVAVVA